MTLPFPFVIENKHSGRDWTSPHDLPGTFMVNTNTDAHNLTLSSSIQHRSSARSQYPSCLIPQHPRHGIVRWPAAHAIWAQDEIGSKL